jgi:hypothetical protein
MLDTMAVIVPSAPASRLEEKSLEAEASEIL